MGATVPARWQHKGRQGKKPRVIVNHCTVSKEMGTGAESVARYFSTTDRKGSAHKVCDNDSTVTCVLDADTAFGAAGANNDGLHLELVGMPDQTEAQWLDDFSRAELREAGMTVRGWATKFDIPLRWLTVAQVADGTSRGLCTHADVSAAFPKVSTGHWDPGPHFPKQHAATEWQLANTTPEGDMDAVVEAHLFVNSLYEAHSKPPPDQKGFDYWLGTVLLGGHTKNDVRLAFIKACKDGGILKP